MRNLLNHRGIKLSLILLGLGLVSLFIQNTFYGYIDDNNVLQDSIFLPLGFFLFLLGSMGLFVSLLKVWLKRKDKD